MDIIFMQANPNVQAFRLCGANGSWEEPDVNSCYYLNEVTKVLEQFAKTNLTFSKTRFELFNYGSCLQSKMYDEFFFL